MLLPVQLYEAEERKKAEVKRQEDLRQQYLKEQELYSSRLGHTLPACHTPLLVLTLCLTDAVSLCRCPGNCWGGHTH